MNVQDIQAWIQFAKDFPQTGFPVAVSVPTQNIQQIAIALAIAIAAGIVVGNVIAKQIA